MSGAAPDEHLHVERLGRLHRLAERGIVVRHVAPAEQRQAFLRHLLGVDVQNDLPPFRIVRHEHVADRVVAGLGQMDAEFFGLADEELVRHLHQDAGAVARARVGADRAAMFEIAEDRDRVLDDLVRLAALDVGDEADAAGILLVARIEQAAARPARVGHNGNSTGESLTVRSAGEALAPTSNRCVPIVVSAVRPCGLRRTFLVHGPSAATQTSSHLVRGGILSGCRLPAPRGTAQFGGILERFTARSRPLPPIGTAMLS